MPTVPVCVLMHFFSLSISFIRLTRIYIKGCWSPKANSTIKWIKGKQPASTSTAQKRGYCEWNSYLLYGHTVPTSNDWIIFEKEKITTQHILIIKPHWVLQRWTMNLLEVEGKGVLWQIFPPTFLLLLSHPSGKAAWRCLCNQPGPARFLTHPAQTANPLQSTDFRFTSSLSELQPANWAQNII